MDEKFRKKALARLDKIADSLQDLQLRIASEFDVQACVWLEAAMYLAQYQYDDRVKRHQSLFVIRELREHAATCFKKAEELRFKFEQECMDRIVAARSGTADEISACASQEEVKNRGQKRSAVANGDRYSEGR